MFSWLELTLISGVLLGFWDIAKKKSLNISPIFTVLALYTTFCFILNLNSLKNSLDISLFILLLIFIKSIFVVCSWIFNFIAIKNLPISIITPFNTLAPIFTIFIGTIFLHERFSISKSIGIVIILTAYFFIGKIGNKEVKGIFKNKYFAFIILSTFFGALSAILDKILLKDITPFKLQFWFCFFLAVLYWIIFLYIKFYKNTPSDDTKPFFNKYIILMSIFLFLSDRIYFTAISQKDSIISIIMPVRSISILISSILGGFIFKEKNLKYKLAGTLLIILGIAIIFK